MKDVRMTRGYDPPTRGNTTVLPVDHQIGLFTGVRDVTVPDLEHNIVALTRAATCLGLPASTPATTPTGFADQLFRTGR
ncbi:hypothetical protein [Actinomadura rupiterrae]|uniref:hypothetical protein n=1 Tax=Actinomadura rupiterrae TaxID=559627 RepID=UPI0020A309FC|nr:hypothetical protein [Actinomadura rupiterrae]MCP2335190.1 hypothetical protein [Actinomadura rupiterrae]